jgi:hypothetical protein
MRGAGTAPSALLASGADTHAPESIRPVAQVQAAGECAAVRKALADHAGQSMFQAGVHMLLVGQYQV